MSRITGESNTLATITTRSRGTLEPRLKLLASQPELPVVLVGGVYLDICLTPVAIRSAQNTEYSDLDTIRAEIGGSAYYVGSYLWEAYKRKSHLFSRVGQGDVFSQHLADLLTNVPWKAGNHVTVSESAQSGVSVHLLDRDGIFSPTLTHRGALNELSWPTMLNGLQDVTRVGAGVMLLSSYFRTGLSTDLVSAINAIPPGVVVAVDHGRFLREDSSSAVRALVSAFRRSVIDIYLCTFNELNAFGRAAGLSLPAGMAELDVVGYLSEESILPKVTVVRGDQNPGVPTAILVVDGELRLVQDGPEDWVPKNFPGSEEAFNAGFLNYFFEPGSPSDLRDMLFESVRAGLRLWCAKS